MSPVDAIRRRARETGGARSQAPSEGFELALDRMLQAQGASPPAPEPAALPEGTVRFSRHARSRMDEAGLTVTQADYAALERGVDELAERGSREALVIIGEIALVVGVPRRVVITAQPLAMAMGTVFTDIDSTLLLESR